ncbi:MAG: class I SAM-dependent methyltransferase [Vicinamibacterales bacterium]
MQLPHSTNADYDKGWRAAMAPHTGDIRRDLTAEAAEYLGITYAEAERRVEASATEFPAEWERLVTDPNDPEQVVRFYNESETELFEQIAWHSHDVIHHRSLVCTELVRTRAPGEFLDYGSGIGSNALIFGLAGFRVTLADVADPLRNFAKWRCERRGIDVRTVDLKHESPGRERYDVITCFDVLEHVPDPLRALKQMRNALRPDGVLFVYAPFGHDPDRPMHIVHHDTALRRIRSLGFDRQYDWEAAFPDYLHHPKPPEAYRRVSRGAPANLAYYIRDVWMNGQIGEAMARRIARLRSAS